METRQMIYMPEMVNFGIIGKKDGIVLIQIFVNNGKELRLKFSLN